MRFSASLLFVLLHSLRAVAAPADSLARATPADARIYLEVRDWNLLLSSPLGEVLTQLAAGFARPLMPPVSTQPTNGVGRRNAVDSRPASSGSAPANAPTSRPASSSWRDRLVTQVGLDPRAIDIILNGRIAMVADGWRALGDAVLLAEPKETAALEAMLNLKRIASITPPAGSSSTRAIQVYKLANEHELACDGARVLIGRRIGASGLYSRTLALWASDHGVALSDTLEYREQNASLPVDALVMVYLTGRTRAGGGSALPALVWPTEWNQYQSIGATLRVTASGAAVDISAYPAPPAIAASPGEPTLLAKLPASTLLAWTRTIGYAEQYRELMRTPDGTFNFYRGVLEAGQPAGALDHQLLSHLTGQTLFLLTRIAEPTTHPASSAPAESPAVWLPAFTLAVKTDGSEVVTSTMLRVVNNLVTLLNVHPPASGPLRITTQPIGPGGGGIWTVPVGRLLTGRPGAEILGQLQLSWTVTDGLLVVGTAPESVRELVLSRRGQASLLAQVPQPSVAGGPQVPQTLLLAQPALSSEMIASWAGMLAGNQAVLRPDFWKQLQSVRALTLQDLGVIPGQATGPVIQVARVVADLPAGLLLRPGDQIVQVDNKPLAANDPVGSCQTLLAGRQQRDRVGLRIRREGQELSIEMPIARLAAPSGSLEPAKLLQESAKALGCFSTARYSVATPASDRLTARLELEFAPRTAAARPMPPG